eukprot:g43199.t1
MQQVFNYLWFRDLHRFLSYSFRRCELPCRSQCCMLCLTAVYDALPLLLSCSALPLSLSALMFLLPILH